MRAKGGAFGPVVGTVAELRPQVAVAQSRAQRLRDQIAKFEVLESYRNLSSRAAQIKSEMQAISRDSISLHETQAHFELSLADERPPARTDLQRLYASAGVELPDLALRRFEDVSRFYDSIIANRRAHLEQEIAEIRRKIAEGELHLSKLDDERSQILRSLEGRGALEDFIRMQGELAAVEANAASLRERFKAAELLEGGAVELEIDRANLQQRLRQDHNARQETLTAAIITIDEEIAGLYDDRTGGFVVDATRNGPEFQVSIEGDRGGGISSMEIFCLDLMLMRTVNARLGGPEFLVHDSHLFDGVDERQIVRAFLLGRGMALDLGRQYIVTMNSDVFDKLPFPADLDRGTAVLDTRLSDDETGGLFGFRF